MPVFKATEKLKEGKRLVAGRKCLVAGRSLADAARQCEFTLFELVAVGRGMEPEAYDLAHGPDPALALSGIYARPSAAKVVKIL